MNDQLTDANPFDAFDQDDDLATPTPQLPEAADFSSPQVDGNLFDQFDRDPDSAREVGGKPWMDDLVNGIALDNARESARALTRAEQDGHQIEIEMPEAEPAEGETKADQASFWSAFEHGLTDDNALAFADTLDHLALVSGDPSYKRSYANWANQIREAFKDGSSYKAVYKSFREIGGVADAWGWAKEAAGRNIGMMTPSLAGGIAGSIAGSRMGQSVAGKFGGRAGGFLGASAGALSGMAHLHISDMRKSLMAEGIEGDQLAHYTTYGAAVLAGLDLAFPTMQALKLTGGVRRQVSSAITRRLLKGGPLRTPAEFIRRFGSSLIKEAALEVATELTQEAITTFLPKEVSGKGTTRADVEKFITETSPEVILQTLVTVGPISTPGSAVQAKQEIDAAKQDIQFPGDATQEVARARKGDLLSTEAAQTIGDQVAETEAPTPAAEEQTPAEERTPVQDTARRAVNVIRYIQELGGIKPTGELAGMNARRFPGLVSSKGLDVDKVRERLVEAGYLEESGPDQPAITTPDDVYELLSRAIGGERVVPLDEQQGERSRLAEEETRAAEEMLADMEATVVLPAISELDTEFGGEYLSQTYASLPVSMRNEVIERAARGNENVDNLIEEMTIRSMDLDGIAGLAVRHGMPAQEVRQLQNFVQTISPDAARTLNDLAIQAQAYEQETGQQVEAAHPGQLPAEQLRAMTRDQLANEAARVGIPLPPSASKRAAIETIRQSYLFPEIRADQDSNISQAEFERADRRVRELAPEDLIDQLQIAQTAAVDDARAGIAQRNAETDLLASRVAALPKEQARAVAEEFLGRPLTSEEATSRNMIAKTVADTIRNAATPQQAEALSAGRVVEEGNVEPTPLAKARATRLRAAVDRAAAGILPESVSVRVVEQISLGSMLKDMRLAVAKIQETIGLASQVSFRTRTGRQLFAELAAPDANGEIAVSVYDTNARPGDESIAELYLVPAGLADPDIHGFDGMRYEVGNVEVSADARRQGINSALYDAIESHLGIRMAPSGLLYPGGFDFWQGRDRTALRGFQFDELEGAYISPRQIKVQIDNLEGSLADAKRKKAKAAQLAPIRDVLGHYQELWSDVPTDLKAQDKLDAMFSVVLRGVHSTHRDFAQFDPDFVAKRDIGYYGQGVYMFPRAYAESFGNRSVRGIFYGTEQEGSRNVPLTVNARRVFTIDTTEGLEVGKIKGDWQVLAPHGWDYPGAPVSYSIDSNRTPESDNQFLPTKEEVEEFQELRKIERIAEERFEAVGEEIRELSGTFVHHIDVEPYAIRNTPAKDKRKVQALFEKLRKLDADMQAAFDRTQNAKRRTMVGHQVAKRFTSALLAAGYDAVVVQDQKNGPYEMVAIRPDTVRHEISGDQFYSVAAIPTKPVGLRGFFSPAIGAVQTMKQEKGSGQQFWAQLRKTPGVKKAELDWMGLEEFLADKKSITKGEILDFMRAHQVMLDERILGAPPQGAQLGAPSIEEVEFSELPQANNWSIGAESASRYRLGDEVRYIIKLLNQDYFVVINAEGEATDNARSFDEAQHLAHGSIMQASGTAADQTQFSHYRIRGGNNYRELLIRMPGFEGTPLAPEENEIVDRLNAEIENRRNAGDIQAANQLSDEALRIIEPSLPAWESPHFKDQEIVHLRVDDRENSRGERILFINELQTDLLQRMRGFGVGPEGYKKAKEIIANPFTPEERRTYLEAQDRYHAINRKVATFHHSTRSPSQELLDAESNAFTDLKNIEDIRNRRQASASRYVNTFGEKGAPNVPYAADSVMELALKRALLYAVENGYDALSWARADQIAPVVGGDVKQLGPQYNEKMGRFLSKYTNKWGGMIEQDGVTRPLPENLHERFSVAMEEVPADSELGDALLRTWNQWDDTGRDEASLDRIIAQFSPGVQSQIKAAIKDAGQKTLQNPIIRITQAMRESIPQGQPLFSLGQTERKSKVVPDYVYRMPWGDLWGDTRFDPVARDRAITRLNEIAQMDANTAPWADLTQAVIDIDQIVGNLYYYDPNMDIETIQKNSELRYKAVRKSDMAPSFFDVELPDVPADFRPFLAPGQAAYTNLASTRRAGLKDLLTSIDPAEMKEPKRKGANRQTDITKRFAGFYFSSGRMLGQVPDAIFNQGGQAVINYLRQNGVKRAEIEHFQLDREFADRRHVSRVEFEQTIARRIFSLRRKMSTFNPERNAGDYEFGGTRAFAGPRIPGRGEYFERLMAFPKTLRGGEGFAPGHFISPHWDDILSGTWSSWRGSVRHIPGLGKVVLGEEGQSDFMQGANMQRAHDSSRRPRITGEEFLKAKARRNDFEAVISQANELVLEPLYEINAGFDRRKEFSDTLIPNRVYEELPLDDWMIVIDELRKEIRNGTDGKPDLQAKLLGRIDDLVALRMKNQDFFAKDAWKLFQATEKLFTPTTPIDESYTRTMVRDLLLLSAQQNADRIAIATSETTARIQNNERAAHFYDAQLRPSLEKELRRLTGDDTLTMERIALPKDGAVPRNQKAYTVWSAPLSPELIQKIRDEGLPFLSIERISGFQGEAQTQTDQSAETLAVLGQTDPHAGLISIAMRATEALAQAEGRTAEEVAARTVRHEAIELFKALGLFTEKEWGVLTKAAQERGWVTDALRANYTQLYGDRMTSEELEALLIKEAIADQYGAYHFTDKKIKGPIGKIFARIKEMLTKIAHWANGLGFDTWQDVFTKADRGELARRYEAAFGTGTPRVDERDTLGAVRAGQLPDAPGFTGQPGAVHPVIGLAEIIRDFRNVLGMPVRQGRLNPQLRRAVGRRGAQLYGQYTRGAGVTRLAVSNDFDTMSHEGGHHMEMRYAGQLPGIMAIHGAELGNLATQIGYQRTDLSEGFAEFFRRYVTNPQTAQAQAPGFYAEFEAMLQAVDPEMLGQLENIQNAYLSFLTGSPVDVASAQQTVLVGRDSMRTRFLQDIENQGVVNTLSDRLHWLYYSTLGKNHGWWMATRALLDLVEENRGQRMDISAIDNPNKLLRMVPHTTSWAQQDLKEGISLAAHPNGIGPSMHAVLNTAFGGSRAAQWNERMLTDFGNYLISRRAVHLFVQHNPALRPVVQQFVAANPQLNYLLARLPQNVESELEHAPTLLPLSNHLQVLLEYEGTQPQFQQAADQYYAFNRNILLFLHEKGLISTEDFNRLVDSPDYAPFQRDMSDRELTSGPDASRRPKVNGPLANKYGVYREIRGSTRDIINPIQSTVQFVYEMRLRAAFNDTLRAMDRLARAAGNGSGAIFERLPAHDARGRDVEIRAALRQAARQAGLSTADTDLMLVNVEGFLGPNAVAQLFTLQQTSENGERIVWFYEDGKPIPALLADGQLGQMMFEAFTTLGRRSPDAWLKMLSLPAGVVRTGVTLAPEFILRNIFVDAIASAVNSPYARPFLTQARGLREVFTGGRYHHLYNRYAGMMGGAQVQAISDQSIERDFEDIRNLGFTIRRPRGVRDFFKMLFQFGEFSETATRVGVFRNAMIANMADGLTEHQAAFEAAHAAHDVMDFSRHGSKTELLRRAIPFFGAATQGMDRYARTMTAQNDHGSAIRAYIDYRLNGGRQLTTQERRAMAQAQRAWIISTLVMGGMSYLFHMLGADDEDMEEIPQRIRATHWIVSLDGVMYFLPKSMQAFLPEDLDTDTLLRLPKPFEMAWFANSMERALDAVKNDDPSAYNEWMKDMWTIIAPPDSIPALDLAYGWMHGQDDFSNRGVIPFWEQDLERSQQFGPYTSEAAKQVGEVTNIAPYYVDYLARGLGASLARDGLSIYDFMSGRGPEPGVEEFPVSRRFTYNVGRSSRSLGQFYDMYRDQEGIVSWFWDTVNSDARSFVAAKNTYRRLKDDQEDEAAAGDLYERLNPDQKVYATLGVDFKKTKAKFRNLHPVENAADGISVTNKLMKEVVTGRVKIGKQEEPIQLDRQKMHFLRNELGHVRRGMAQNSLHIMGVPGWAHQQAADVDARLRTVKGISEPVYEELIRRLKKEHFLDFKHLKTVWPEVKERVLADRDEALISDLFHGGEIVAE